MAARTLGTTPLKRMTTAAIISRYRDAVRSQESADYGLAAQPRRDLAGPRFAEQLEEPWKLELAYRMARHARSTDPCRGVWPYERFEQALEKVGTPIPDRLTLAGAVGIVDAALRASSMKWYDANIARPMGRRAAATRVGTSLLDEEDGSHGDPRMGLRQPDYSEELIVLAADLDGCDPHSVEPPDQYGALVVAAAAVVRAEGLHVSDAESLDEWTRALAD